MIIILVIMNDDIVLHEVFMIVSYSFYALFEVLVTFCMFF